MELVLSIAVSCLVLSSSAVASSEILVKFKNNLPTHGAYANSINLLQNKLGKNSITDVRALKTDESVGVVALAENGSAEDALTTLKNNPDVQYAEKNFVINMFMDAEDPSPLSDPEFNKQWGMRNTGQKMGDGWIKSPGVAGADINVLPLWEKGITGSKDIIVAVIDTGLDMTHSDLAANVYKNTKEIPGNGIDDDGNGFIDDVNGWNFVNNTNDPTDDQGHGTHCAGVIGAVGSNNIGVAGVNWNVQIMPLKFLNGSGQGKLEGAVEAVNYATKMGVHVMSNSWGGGEKSDLLKDAIVKAKDAGILFVAAAGNSRGDNDAKPSYPASYPVENIVAVAATDFKDTLASFSNYGAKTVHVAAPGVNIHSTVKGNSYKTMSGTSMACPHVAGVAALALSHNKGLKFSELKDRLISTSTPVTALSGKVLSGGRINAEAAVRGTKN